MDVAIYSLADSHAVRDVMAPEARERGKDANIGVHEQDCKEGQEGLWGDKVVHNVSPFCEDIAACDEKPREVKFGAQRARSMLWHYKDDAVCTGLGRDCVQMEFSGLYYCPVVLGDLRQIRRLPHGIWEVVCVCSKAEFDHIRRPPRFHARG